MKSCLKLSHVMGVAALYVIISSCANNDNTFLLGAEEKQGYSPGDAKFKFLGINEDTVFASVQNFIVSQHIVVDESEIAAIGKWIKDEVFNNYYPGDPVVEWNIDDPDFCFIQNTYTGHDTLSIKVCNTKLNKDVVSVNFAMFQHGQRTWQIDFQSKVIKGIGEVPYYGLHVENNQVERSLITTNLKLLVKTKVILTLNNPASSSVVAEGDAYMYTALRVPLKADDFFNGVVNADTTYFKIDPQ